MMLHGMPGGPEVVIDAIQEFTAHSDLFTIKPSPTSRSFVLFCFLFFFFATIDCSLVNSIIPTRFSKEHNLVLPPHKKM